MDPLSQLLTDQQIAQAKERVWKRMESRLPERGEHPYSPLVKVLKKLEEPQSRLQKVMLKERLLDKLPDRITSPMLLSRKVWATGTLSLFFAFLLAPVFTLSAPVQASAVNVLEVVQGEVLVNGAVVTDVALVQKGDEIVTQGGSMAHLQLYDDTRITLGPRTELKLQETEGLSLYQEKGRLWTQVVNPVNLDSAVTIAFPEGVVVAHQKASFDIQVDSKVVQVQVAENVVSVNLAGQDSYEGTLGQGVQLNYDQGVELARLPDNIQEDVWWEFNESYGERYLSSLNEAYAQETLASVSILPDHPLYFLKSWREVVQESLTISDSAKQELVAQHMELRLNEAQILMDQGKMEAAQEALVAYQAAVEKNLELAGASAVESQLEEAQKELLAKLEMDEGSQLIEDQLLQTSALVADSLSEKNEVRMLSASQKLSRVPGLIESGDFELAYYYLEAYKEESLSILTELESVPMEEREALVSALLDQKLQDLQMLRVIAAMPEFTEVVDAQAQILQEISVMVLSLRERTLTRLSEFFTSTEYDVEMQYELYATLKEDTPLTPAITDQLEAVEHALEEELPAADPSTPGEEVVDPRFVTPEE